MRKRKFDIEGMTCASCQLTIEKSVKKLGVDSINVSLLTNSMEVEGDNISDEDIIKAVSNSGYTATPRNREQNKKIKNPKKEYDKEKSRLKNVLRISIPFMLILMYVAMGEMLNLPYPSILKGYEGAGIFAFIQLIISIPVLYVNRNYFINGYKSLFKKSPNMDTLVALGASAAVIYGIFASLMIYHGLGTISKELVHTYRHDLYYEAGTMILTLISFGKYLEVNSKAKTTEAINKLIELQPDKVTVIKNGEEIIIPVEDVQVGDIIKVIPGERISMDGVVVDGKSSIDTSAITGESMPVEISDNDKVISGSINNEGSFTMKASTVGSETTIFKIINLMEEASASKAPISKLADKISGIFVPIVIGIAIIAFVTWTLLGYSLTFSLSTAIGVLVISCPCALGLATPVSMMVATGKSAENGILVKNTESLELLDKIDTIIFDKTGTITKGKPVLTDIVTVNNFKINKAIKIAYALEKNSQHPLAKSIKAYAKEKDLEENNIKDFNSITGKGVEGIVYDEKYYLGNDKLLNEKLDNLKEIYDTAYKLSKDGKTVVFLFNEREMLAIFAIADTIKETSKYAVNEIKKLGIKTVMLTGDNKLVAKKIAEEVGVDEYNAEMLPNEKDDAVLKYQDGNKKVAMVGDGINDAPALMRSDVGIAIADGTDIAISSADLVLIKSDLQDILASIKLSKQTIKNIRQNLFWAFFYNILAIPVAFGIFYPYFGLRLNPMIGALAMSLSSVFVVSNSLRLRAFKIENKKFDSKDLLSNTVNHDTISINKVNRNSKKKGKTSLEKRIIEIEGMSCSHCKMSVTKELSKIAKDVEVSLEKGEAAVLVSEETSDDTLIQAVSNAGYEAVSIK